MMGSMSPADIQAVTGCNNDGMNGGGNWIWIILLFLFFGRDGFGQGGEHVATSADVQRGFDTNSVMNKLNGIENGLCDGFYAQNTTMLQGFNAQNVASLQGFNALGMAVAQGDNALSTQIAECCCKTQTGLLENRYLAERNTCDIVQAIYKDGQETRQLIVNNTMQDLRDRLAEKDRDVAARDAQLSQLSQTSAIISAVRPCPVPAYQTCNPWANTYTGC